MACKRYRPYDMRFTHQFTIIFILIMICCILVGLGSLLGSKSKASDDRNYKYYTSVEVKKGDTLWDIASEYVTEEYGSLYEYVAEVKAVNGLQSDYIRYGQSLIIPYYSSELK